MKLVHKFRLSISTFIEMFMKFSSLTRIMEHTHTHKSNSEFMINEKNDLKATIIVVSVGMNEMYSTLTTFSSHIILAYDSRPFDIRITISYNFVCWRCCCCWILFGYSTLHSFKTKFLEGESRSFVASISTFTHFPFYSITLWNSNKFDMCGFCSCFFDVDFCFCCLVNIANE